MHRVANLFIDIQSFTNSKANVHVTQIGVTATNLKANVQITQIGFTDVQS